MSLHTKLVRRTCALAICKHRLTIAHQEAVQRYLFFDADVRGGCILNLERRFLCLRKYWCGCSSTRQHSVYALKLATSIFGVLIELTLGFAADGNGRHKIE